MFCTFERNVCLKQTPLMGTLANSEDPDEMHSSGSALFANIKTTFKEGNTSESRKIYL